MLSNDVSSKKLLLSKSFRPNPWHWLLVIGQRSVGAAGEDGHVERAGRCWKSGHGSPNGR